MTRLAALDYGTRRIGIALSDPTGTIAYPLTTVSRRKGKRPPWPEITRLLAEHAVSGVVVGLPLDLAGEEGEWAAEVRDFADQRGLEFVADAMNDDPTYLRSRIRKELLPLLQSNYNPGIISVLSRLAEQAEDVHREETESIDFRAERTLNPFLIMDTRLRHYRHLPPL